MKGIHRYNSASVYHMIPQNEQSSSCWHCCEPVTRNESIPIPKVYDTAEKVFHVYGTTCSPSCAKAYIVEHTSFDRGQNLNVLSKMLREVYDVNEPVPIAPPRCSYKRFGGVFDPKKDFSCDFTLLHPPFVSYCMLVEEKMNDSVIPAPKDKGSPSSNMIVEEADTFDEPHPAGLYTDFLQNMQDRKKEEDTDNEQRKGEKKATKRSLKGGSNGPMSKFIRPSSP